MSHTPNLHFKNQLLTLGLLFYSCCFSHHTGGEGKGGTEEERGNHVHAVPDCYVM